VMMNAPSHVGYGGMGHADPSTTPETKEVSSEVLDRPDEKRARDSHVRVGELVAKLSSPTRLPGTRKKVKGSAARTNRGARRPPPKRLSAAQRAERTVEESKVAVKGCVSALFSLLRIFGLRPGAMTDRAYQDTVEHWFKGATASGSWIKFAKYKFARFFWHYTTQEDSPPCEPWPEGSFADAPGVLACGVAGRLAQKLSRGPTRWEFLASVLQVKKGCPRPSETDLKEAVEKAMIALSTFRQDPPECIVAYGQNIDDLRDAGVPHHLSRDTLCAALRRTVREVFEGKTYSDEDRYRVIFPSTSACFTSAKADGGLAGEFAEFCRTELISEVQSEMDWYERRGYDIPDPSAPLPGPAEEQPRVLRVTEFTPKKQFVRWERSVPFDLPEEGAQRERTPFTIDLTYQERFARKSYLRLLEKARTEPSNVRPVGLAESLKVRIITAGSMALQKVMHPLQKFLWRSLVSHPVFRLIGEPVTARIVQDALGSRLGVDEYYLSGDYSAATDNLAPWVSNTIADEIAAVCGLTPAERECFLKSLTGNIFFDNAKEVLKGGLPQEWGQLMGSVISFPVLCIANAALCRWSLEIVRAQTLTLKELPMLVNGDDVVFRTTLQGHKIWERITHFAGLSSSIGKTFLTKEFAQINSANFVRRESPVDDIVETKRGPVNRPLWFRETKYVNLGLLYGMKRSGEQVGEDAITSTFGSLGTRARELVDKCPCFLRAAVFRQFLRHHSDVLSTCRVPWFVPEQWGGVGLPEVCKESELEAVGWLPGDPLPDPKYWCITKRDLQTVRVMANEPRRADGKLKYPITTLPKDADWTTHAFVLRNYSHLYTEGTPTEEEESASRKAYAALCFDALVFHDEELNRSAVGRRNSPDVMSHDAARKKKHAEAELRALQINRRSWEAASRSSLPTEGVSKKFLFETSPIRPFIPVDNFVSLYDSKYKSRGYTFFDPWDPEVVRWRGDNNGPW